MVTITTEVNKTDSQIVFLDISLIQPNGDIIVDTAKRGECVGIEFAQIEKLPVLLAPYGECGDDTRPWGDTHSYFNRVRGLQLRCTTHGVTATPEAIIAPVPEKPVVEPKPQVLIEAPKEADAPHIFPTLGTYDFDQVVKFFKNPNAMKFTKLILISDDTQLKTIVGTMADSYVMAGGLVLLSSAVDDILKEETGGHIAIIDQFNNNSADYDLFYKGINNHVKTDCILRNLTVDTELAKLFPLVDMVFQCGGDGKVILLKTPSAAALKLIGTSK